MSDNSNHTPVEKPYTFGHYEKIEVKIEQSVYALNAPIPLIPGIPTGPFPT
jgi:hypothetical protein